MDLHLGDIETRMPIMLSEADAQCLIRLLEEKSGRSDLEDSLLDDLKIFWHKHFSGSPIFIP